MDKKNWGTKRLCECSKKFYDFNKNPIVCPCGKTQTYEDKFAKLAAVKPVSAKKEIDPGKVLIVTNLSLYAFFIIINFFFVYYKESVELLSLQHSHSRVHHAS